jgi:hypothetical protein
MANTDNKCKDLNIKDYYRQVVITGMASGDVVRLTFGVNIIGRVAFFGGAKLFGQHLCGVKICLGG